MCDKQLEIEIKEKIGFQQKVVYCKECTHSLPNPDVTNRSHTLVCNNVGSLLQFPVMKMSTCARSEAPVVVYKAEEK